MMETAVTLLWLLCSVLCPSPDRPYLPADSMRCGFNSGMVCCDLTYTVAAQGQQENNTLRSTEIWCINSACHWSLEGYGWH